MLAIVDLNGKQYQVEEGRYVQVDRLSLEPNEELELANVLMVLDGEESLVGAPFVDGALVKAKVLSHGRGPKVRVYKMRRKKGYRRTNGFRADFTRLQIELVSFPGKKATTAKASAAASEKTAEAKPKAKKASAAPAEVSRSEAQEAPAAENQES